MSNIGNAHFDFPESKVESTNVLFCPANRSKDIQVIIMSDIRPPIKAVNHSKYTLFYSLSLNAIKNNLTRSRIYDLYREEPPGGDRVALASLLETVMMSIRYTVNVFDKEKHQFLILKKL